MSAQDRSSPRGHWPTPPNHPPGRGPHMSQPFSQPSIPNTYHPAWPRQAYPYPPPLPPQPRTRAKAVAVVALSLSAIGLLVLVVIGLHGSGGATAAHDQVATSTEIAAICQPGSFEHKSGQDAPTFQGANDVAMCTAKIGAFPEAPTPSEQHGPIWIVQFPSSSAARNEARAENMVGATAITTIGGKTVLFCATADWTGASLEPLTQFGISITRGG